MIRSDSLQRIALITGFLLIPLVLLALFTYYPVVRLFVISFTNWDGMSPSYQWVGWRNFYAVFTNPQLFGVFRHNLWYFIGGIVQNIVALYFAVILNSKIRGRNFFRLMLFLPYIINIVAVSYMFQFVFQDTGALNRILQAIGLAGLQQSWLGNPHLVNGTLAFVSMWKYMGFNMVIYLGALQSLPQDMYEAAKLDGASGWQTFFHITLPNILSIIEVNLLLTVTGALQAFEIPYVMTNAAPGTETFVTKTVDVAFKFDNYGLASAMAVILLFIVAAIIFVQRKLLAREHGLV